MKNTDQFGLSLAEIYQETLKNPEILDIGNSMFAGNLTTVVSSINEQMVKSGNPTWRLPTLAELRTSFEAKDNRFGQCFVWSGEYSAEDRGATMWAKDMTSGEEVEITNRNEIKALLVKGDIKP